MSKRISQISESCVACGNCVKSCPFGALAVYKGLRAIVDPDKCRGCGKCAPACPAGIIRICERSAL